MWLKMFLSFKFDQSKAYKRGIIYFLSAELLFKNLVRMFSEVSCPSLLFVDFVVFHFFLSFPLSLCRFTGLSSDHLFLHVAIDRYFSVHPENNFPDSLKQLIWKTAAKTAKWSREIHVDIFNARWFVLRFFIYNFNFPNFSEIVSSSDLFIQVFYSANYWKFIRKLLSNFVSVVSVVVAYP